MSFGILDSRAVSWTVLVVETEPARPELWQHQVSARAGGLPVGGWARIAATLSRAVGSRRYVALLEPSGVSVIANSSEVGIDALHEEASDAQMLLMTAISAAGLSSWFSVPDVRLLGLGSANGDLVDVVTLARVDRAVEAATFAYVCGLAEHADVVLFNCADATTPDVVFARLGQQCSRLLGALLLSGAGVTPVTVADDVIISLTPETSGAWELLLPSIVDALWTSSAEDAFDEDEVVEPELTFRALLAVAAVLVGRLAAFDGQTARQGAEELARLRLS